jgi:large subunit ribosomal protein L3
MTQLWKQVDTKTTKDKKVVTVQVLKVIPVTVVHATPNTVSLVRTEERDGYQAVQLLSGKKKKEFRLAVGAGLPSEALAKEGASIDVSVFAEGDKVFVTGVTKGRGFAGVVKRHNFAGGPKTHGQKNRHRHPGSIGSTAFQRVVPGLRMAGHMGTERKTIKGLTVVQVDPEKNLLYIKGSIPGARNGLLEIRKK